MIMLNIFRDMRRLASYILFITIFSSVCIKAESVTVSFPNEPEKKVFVESIKLGRTTYISAKDLAEALAARIYENVDRGKMVIYFGGHRIKISANCGFVLVDDKAYQMPAHPVQNKGDIYLPMRMFLEVFNRHAAPGVAYDELRNVIVVEILTYNITGIKIEEKSNGTLIRIQTTRQFDEGQMTAWSAQNGWFYLTVVGGVGDSVSIQKTQPVGIVLEAQMDQTGRTAQLAFRLRSNIESHDLHQNTGPDEILLTLRSPLILSEEKMRRSRDYWYIDTIVLDAGHGGKDGGTTGKYGLQEKFITLDITKRLGRLLEKHTNVQIIYTRDEDVFVPLWKRTKSANESNGKLFVSIHANAHKSRRIKGFETYILSPGKTGEAAAVAERENAAIKLEEEESRYEHLMEDNFIIASLMQNAFMKESEELANIVQTQLRKSIPSPDRGIKQAGFYVLVGASMPNILVEVGYLSNPQEEKQLRKPGYRQSIAEAIYRGIRKFKDKSERLLQAEG